MAFLTISRSSSVKGRRPRKLGPTYSDRGFAEGLGALDFLLRPAFAVQGVSWGVDLIESGGPGDAS